MKALANEPRSTLAVPSKRNPRARQLLAARGLDAELRQRAQRPMATSTAAPGHEERALPPVGADDLAAMRDTLGQIA